LETEEMSVVTRVLRAEWCVLFAMVLLTGGCGERAPDEVIDDPAAFAVTALGEAELRDWWEPYRNDDPTFLAEVVAQASEGLKDGLPKSRRKLERVIKTRVLPRYRTRMEKSEEGKRFIAERAEERLADPPSAVWDKAGRYALLDFHVLPGEWKSTSRTSEGMKDSPALARAPFLKATVLKRALGRLKVRHPEAKVYQLRYEYFFGSSRKRVLMTIYPNGSIVYREGVRVAFTEKAVPWDELAAGRIELETLDWDGPMEGRGGPDLNAPPRDILPLRR
jgi:hypothetical protein